VFVVHGDIANAALLAWLFQRIPFTHVAHMAAQAGVRYAMDNPQSYIHSNVEGFVSVLEASRRADRPPAIVWASSSSVYGLNRRAPFSERHATDRPASLYGATKKAGEALSALVQPPPRPLPHGPALLHRLRALGPTRHGLLLLHAGHSPRAAHQDLHEARPCESPTPQGPPPATRTLLASRAGGEGARDRAGRRRASFLGASPVSLASPSPPSFRREDKGGTWRDLKQACTVCSG